MSYVGGSLISGEDVVYKARIHWITYIPYIVLLLMFFVLISNINDKMNASGKTSKGSFAAFLVLVSVSGLIIASVMRSNTELAITSKRIISKRGLVGKQTIEISHDKIESFDVHQGIFGALFDYGTIVIHGVGGSQDPFKFIKSPLVFRRKAMEAIEAELKRNKEKMIDINVMSQIIYAADEIMKLKSLLDKGVITQYEFKESKKRLLEL